MKMSSRPMNGTLALTFALMAISGCAAKRNTDGSDTAGASGANGCQTIISELNSVASGVSEACESIPLASIKDVVGGLWTIMELVANKAPSPMTVALAGADTSCKVAKATVAAVEMFRSQCSAQKAEMYTYKVSADLCTRMNAVPDVKRHAGLPSWCPDKADNLFYCAPNGRFMTSVACMQETGGPVGSVKEFVAGPSQRVSIGGVEDERRLTRVRGEACYVVDRSLVCSH